MVPSPLLSSLHSPLFRSLEASSVSIPHYQAHQGVPKPSCLQKLYFSQISKVICLLNSFLFPATTETVSRKLLGLLDWDFFIIDARVISSNQWAGLPVGSGDCMVSGSWDKDKKGSRSLSWFWCSDLLDWPNLLMPQLQLSFLWPWAPEPHCWREKNSRFTA